MQCPPGECMQGVKEQKEVWLWLDNKQFKFLPFKCISGVLCSLNAAVIKKLFLVLSPISIANFCDFCFPWFVLLKLSYKQKHHYLTVFFLCITYYITPGILAWRPYHSGESHNEDLGGCHYSPQLGCDGGYLVTRVQLQAPLSNSLLIQIYLDWPVIHIPNKCLVFESSAMSGTGRRRWWVCSLFSASRTLPAEQPTAIMELATPQQVPFRGCPNMTSQEIHWKTFLNNLTKTKLESKDNFPNSIQSAPARAGLPLAPAPPPSEFAVYSL